MAEMNVELNEKSRKGSIFIWVIFLLLIIGGAGAVVYFNVGNITDKYLRSTLEKVPIVKNVLPEQEVKDPNEEKTKEALLQEIHSLEEQINNLNLDKENYNIELENLTKENSRLQEMEQRYEEFQAEKQSFDQMIANEDPNEYASFYEQINPKTAEEIYRAIVQEQVQNKRIRDYTDTYQQMDASSGAAILEEMIVTDMDLVVLIITNIDSEQRAKILAEMSPENAARVTKRMSPEGA